MKPVRSEIQRALDWWSSARMATTAKTLGPRSSKFYRLELRPCAVFEQVLQEAWALMYIAEHSEGHPSRHNIVTLHGLCIELPSVQLSGLLCWL